MRTLPKASHHSFMHLPENTVEQDNFWPRRLWYVMSIKLTLWPNCPMGQCFISHSIIYFRLRPAQLSNTAPQTSGNDKNQICKLDRICSIVLPCYYQTLRVAVKFNKNERSPCGIRPKWINVYIYFQPAFIHLFIYLYLFILREREHKWASGGERGRERLSSSLFTASAWCRARSHNCEIMTWAEIKSWTLNQTEPPRSPPTYFLNSDQSQPSLGYLGISGFFWLFLA